MASVTINGHTYSDDSSPTTGLGGGGHRTRFIPLIQDVVAVIGDVASMGDVALEDATNTFTARQILQYSATLGDRYFITAYNTATDTANGVMIGLKSGASGSTATVEKFGSEYTTVAAFANRLVLNDDASGSGIVLNTANTSSGAIDLGINNVIKVRLNKDGNLLLNTTTDDSTGAKLQVDGDVNIHGGSHLHINATQVVSTRKTGWTAASGTATRTTFATSTVTTTQLAERVKALIDDLISHGLIGT